VHGTLSVIDSTDYGATEPAIGFPASYSDFHDFAYDYKVGSSPAASTGNNGHGHGLVTGPGRRRIGPRASLVTTSGIAAPTAVDAP